MRVDSTLRVMWLLNHTTLRQFEIPQILNDGVSEIFLPKYFPWNEGNLSATVSFEYDDQLSLSKHDLDYLNRQDWYGNPEKRAWNIVNTYFDIIFIGFFPAQIKSSTKNFNGQIILRAFGLGGEETYSRLIQTLDNSELHRAITKTKKNFWFGMGYNHLSESEEKLVASRSIFMPVGLKSIKISDDWVGSNKHILFVCPRIGSSPYFNNIYIKFINDFKDFPYRIGGAQPIDVDDANVLGFLSNKEYQELMVDSRVMFYHSAEPNHIHYHPFEAIRAGMPLVFMAGGMLDRLGGLNLPGRAKSITDAKIKIKKILNDDFEFIKNIKASQVVLLKCMDPRVCELPWKESFSRVLSASRNSSDNELVNPLSVRKTRIAVIVPVGYRGGSLRGSKLMAQALQHGAAQNGETIEVILLHLDDPQTYTHTEFEDLPTDIKTRSFNWRTLKADEARRAMRYAGHAHWEP